MQLSGGTWQVDFLLGGSDCSGFIHGPGSLFTEAIPLKSETLRVRVFPYFVKRYILSSFYCKNKMFAYLSEYVGGLALLLLCIYFIHLKSSVNYMCESGYLSVVIQAGHELLLSYGHAQSIIERATPDNY